MEITRAMLAVVEYCQKKGVTNIRDLPGVYEADVDDDWHIALNGHAENLRVTYLGADVEVEPYKCFVWYRGFPAAYFSATDGVCVAGWVNEDTFVQALRRAAEEETCQN